MNSSKKKYFQYSCGFNLTFAIAILFSILLEFPLGVVTCFSILLLTGNLALLTLGIRENSKLYQTADRVEKTDPDSVDHGILSDLDSELARRKAQKRLERN